MHHPRRLLLRRLRDHAGHARQRRDHERQPHDHRRARRLPGRERALGAARGRARTGLGRRPVPRGPRGHRAPARGPAPAQRLPGDRLRPLDQAHALRRLRDRRDRDHHAALRPAHARPRHGHRRSSCSTRPTGTSRRRSPWRRSTTSSSTAATRWSSRPFEQRVNGIRGPVIIDGGLRLDDERFLNNPLMLPGEKNLPLPSGTAATVGANSITDLDATHVSPGNGLRPGFDPRMNDFPYSAHAAGGPRRDGRRARHRRHLARDPLGRPRGRLRRRDHLQRRRGPRGLGRVLRHARPDAA